MRKTLLVTCVLLLAALAAASTPADNSQAASSAVAIRTYMLPDFTFTSVITFDALPSQTAAAETPALAGNRPKRGFCRCSCGFACSTSADCGGVSCDPFITCCVRDPQSKGNDWFATALTQASHKRSVPEVLVKANCK